MVKKRKEFDGSLFFPSTKSRRLDAELLPLMQQNPSDQIGAAAEWLPFPGNIATSMIQTDNLEDRASVLFNPQNTQFLRSPTRSLQLPIVLDSALLPGIQDHLFWPGNPQASKLLGDEVNANKSTDVSINSMAVVPWSALQKPWTSLGDGQQAPVPCSPEPMDTAQEGEMMDIEDASHNSFNWKAFKFNQMVRGTEGLIQQQQHGLTVHSKQVYASYLMTN